MKARRLTLKWFITTSLAVLAAGFGLAIVLETMCFPEASLLLQTCLHLACEAGAALLVVGIAAHVLKRSAREAAGLEIKFQNLLQAASDAIVITGKKALITLVNRRAETLFGYEQQEVQGRPLESLFDKRASRGRGEIRAGLHSTCTTVCTSEADDLVGRCKDGSEIYVEISSSPLKTEEGIFIVHIIRNVTERKIRERHQLIRQAVRRVLAETTTLSDAAPGILQTLCKGLEWDRGAIWMVDPSTHEWHCAGREEASPSRAPGLNGHSKTLDPNRACTFAPNSGIPGGGLTNSQPIWIADVTRDTGPPQLAVAAKVGFHSALCYPVVLGTEVVGMIELFAHKLRERDEGVLETLHSVGHKIGEFLRRKQAERAVYESEARKTAVFEAALDAIITIDQEGKILEFNPAAERIFGHPRAQVIGLDLAELILPEAQRGSLDLKAEATGEGLALDKRLEMSAVRADGETFPIELTVTRIPNEGRCLFTAYLRDLSERKQAEAALRQAEERYRQAQKMEAVGRLAGGIAHDFNNILTIITGCGDLLLRDLPTDNPARNLAQNIIKAAERATGLVQQILTFSRKRVMAPEILDLNQTVTDLNQMLQRLIGEDIDLATSLGSDLGSVKVDRGQIEQVIMNLVLNARDAMPEGGKVTIETAKVELDEAYTSAYPGVLPGSYVMLAVTDTGCGMDKEVKARLFEPFFTTKEQGKGTGLGLATVYGVVKQSDGYIAVYSEPGQGTTFKIYLPAVKEAAAAPPSNAQPAPLPPGTGTVLLVEDQEDVRELSRNILRMNGYTVLEARHGREALELSEQQPAAFDLIVTDVVMPEMNGCELAGRLLSRQPDLKVLFVSGYADSAVFRHGVLNDGAAFLQKPFTPQALVNKVRQLLSA